MLTSSRVSVIGSHEGSTHVAVALTKEWDPVLVDGALGLAATVGRFGAGDVESIRMARRQDSFSPPVGFSLQPGTGAWSRYGNNNDNGDGNGDQR